MTQTVTALYDTYDSAVSAVNALEAYGIPHSDISIVSNNVDDRYGTDRATNAADSSEGRIRARIRDLQNWAAIHRLQSLNMRPFRG